MIYRKAAAFIGAAAVVVAACGGGATASPAASSGGAAGCTVGVSWNNYQEERWAKWDEPALKKAIEDAGGKYISNDAASSEEKQASNVENLISQGAKVVVVLAQNGEAIKPAVAAAIADGVPVIAYDRLIEDPKALYITFDNVLVGKLQAEAVLKVVPEGNFAIIKGNSADANADFLRAGMVEAGVPTTEEKTNGKINIVGETYTDNWDPANAQTEMEQILAANNNKIDAVLSENDGMAGGVIAALAAQGLAGKVPVSGQDGDAAALNRVALGTQTVDVWKDARMLGKAAGDAAIQMCGGDLTKVAGTAPFTSPGGNTLTSILLTPQPITKDNLNVVLDAGWITQDVLCKDVKAGSVAGCP